MSKVLPLASQPSNDSSTPSPDTSSEISLDKLMEDLHPILDAAKEQVIKPDEKTVNDLLGKILG
ncbi:MAG TPA: hypothetical protein PLQ78_09135 [Flavipsychrobacter sp.]|jgi:hypothetical protein|nr:hypothetical protein [Flavipsychrobacter sp.]